jgi:hypothetical protein
VIADAVVVDVGLALLFDPLALQAAIRVPEAMTVRNAVLRRE